MEKTALFPGSFDPFTLGHQAIVENGLKIFDRIVVGIGSNSEKNGLLTVENRKRLIEDLYGADDRVTVAVYSELTGEFCRQIGANFLLRGMRNTVDYEYERNMMVVNQMLFPEITTVMLFTPPDVADISSSTVREVLAFGRSVAEFLPRGIELENYL